MKKTLFYFSALLLAVLMTIGCSKNEDNPTENYFKYSGKTHSIEEAVQVFYGDYFSSAANNITLLFATDEHYIALELFVPKSGTKLVAGTYEADDSYEAFTVSEGAVLKKSDESVLYSMLDGVVSIKLEGSVYTIDMEGTLNNSTSITGNYTGQIRWVDGTED